MELDDLKLAWKSYERKLDTALSINMKILEDIQSRKIKSKMTALVFLKVLSFLVLIGLIGFLSTILFQYHFNWFFKSSISMITLVYAIALVSHLKQLILIARINKSESVVETQANLAVLEASLIQGVRIMCLPLPFFCTWFLTDDMIKYGNLHWWIFEALIVTSFTGLAIFLYKNISIKNVHKPWVQLLIRGSGTSYVIKAQSFLREIERFKKESD